MENQALQAAIKSDLITIPTLKMGILSAGDLYGSLARFILKFSVTLLCINILIQAGLYGVGRYHQSWSVLSVLLCGILTLGGSGFITLFLSHFILFEKLAKGRLKTTAFIKKKCRHFISMYLSLYSVIYCLGTLFFGTIKLLGADSTGRLPLQEWIFNEFFSLTAALLGSFLIMSLILNMEISRLGLGPVFDIINAFATRMNNNPSTDASLNGEDPHDAR